MKSEYEGHFGFVGFGRFRFNVATGELWCDGQTVHLAPKPARVLGLLLRADGDLVPRKTIELEIWGNQPIDLQRSVNFAIRQVRSALGDSAEAPVYIETLPKRGYRFIAPVTAYPLSESGRRPVVLGPPNERSGTAQRSRTVRAKNHPRSDRFRWAVIGTVAVLLAAAGVALARAETAESRAGGDATTTLAVLPLERLIDDTRHDYFLAGLTDEIITRLARLDPERLTVIAPTSARRAAEGGRSDEEIASALTASYLLRGSVTPTADGVRVGVRLVDPSDGSVIWAERYVEPIPTSPALEYEIATRVADALRARLPLREGPSEPLRAVSQEAHVAFLRGSYLLGRDGRLGDAIAFLDQAVRSDSMHAPSRSVLARALWRQGRIAEGRAHLEAAIKLDPRLTDARVGLGIDALYRRWDLERAQRHFEQALASDPGNVLSHHPYAYYLSIVGRHEEAISQIETALALDPISPLVNGDVGRIYYRAGRFDEARAQCQRAVELQENHATALSCLVNIHLLAGDTKGALPYAIRNLGESDEMIAVAERLRSQDPDSAMEDYFDWRLTVLEGRRADGQDVAVPIAQALIWLGRLNEALDALEAALDARSSVLPQVPGDPYFAVLHGNPRFDAIIGAMGIPR